MNNNEIKFDPATGQPIQNNMDNNTQTNIQVNNQVQTVAPVAPIEPQVNPTNEQSQTVAINPQINNIDTSINNIQSIPTVDQSKQEFINNTQSLAIEKKTEKKHGINWIFIIALFVIILVAIIFLFPYLLKNL